MQEQQATYLRWRYREILTNPLSDAKQAEAVRQAIEEKILGADSNLPPEQRKLVDKYKKDMRNVLEATQ
jgi:hypothetical protein